LKTLNRMFWVAQKWDWPGYSTINAVTGVVVSVWAQKRRFRTAEKHRSTDSCRRHQVTPRLKLVDGNILKKVSRYIDSCVTNYYHHYTVPCSACSEYEDHEAVHHAIPIDRRYFWQTNPSTNPIPDPILSSIGIASASPWSRSRHVVIPYILAAAWMSGCDGSLMSVSAWGTREREPITTVSVEAGCATIGVQQQIF